MSRWSRRRLTLYLLRHWQQKRHDSAPTPTPSDSTPDAFSFSAVTEAVPSTVVTSNAVFILGIDIAAPISIVGGEYQIGAGSWTSSPGTITLGQAVRVRLTTSSAYHAVNTATLTIGGVDAVFSVTTAYAIITSNPPPAQIGVPYSYTPTWEGLGVPTHSGTLPAGITYSAGTYSGTPT